VAFPGGVLTADGDTFSFQPHWNYANPIDGTLWAVRYVADSRGNASQMVSTGSLPLSGRSAEHSALRARHRHERSAHDSAGSVVVTTTSGWYVISLEVSQVWHRSQIMDLAYASTTANLSYTALAEPGALVRITTTAFPTDTSGNVGFVDAMLDFPRTPARSRSHCRAMSASPRHRRVQSSPNGTIITFDSPFGSTASYRTIFTDLRWPSSSLR